MSTRSGKRIHGSIHEKSLDNKEVKSERKTRGKRRKENCVEVLAEQSRKHYVRYPSEEDAAIANEEKTLRITRKSQRNALKEQNIFATDSETSNDDGQTARLTRRAKKIETAENVEPNGELKPNKKHKINRKSKIQLATENTLIEPVLQTKQKSNKKMGKRKSFLIVEDTSETVDGNNDLSNMSIDSFHTAAGSSVLVYNEKVEEYNEQKVLELPSIETKNNKCVSLDVVESNKPNRKRNKKLTVEVTNNESEIKGCSDEIINESAFHYIKTDTQCINPPTRIVSPTLVQSSQKKCNKKKKSSKVSISVNDRTEILSTSEVDHNESTNQLQTLNNTDTDYIKKKRKSSSGGTGNKPEIFNELVQSHDNLNSRDSDRSSNKKKHKSSNRKSTSDNIGNIISLDVTCDREQQSVGTTKIIENLDNEKDCCEYSQGNLININGSLNSGKKKLKSSTRKSTSDKVYNTSVVNCDESELKQPANLQISLRQISKRSSKYSLGQDDSSNNLNITYDKILKSQSQRSSHNSTYDKSSKLNATLDLIKDCKLDVTFDKSPNNRTTCRSSTISFDTTDNIATSSKDNTRITITSDDSSSAENIVLIESSIDESLMNNSSNKLTTLELFNTKETKNRTPVKCEESNTDMESSATASKCESPATEHPASRTPLKHGGTYTEIKTSTTPKCEETATEGNTSRIPLKREGTYIRMKSSTTLQYNNAATEMKDDKTSLNHDVTYTEPTSVPDNNNEENNPVTPKKCDRTLSETVQATTPLKREGTFTKEDPVSVVSPNGNMSKTPTRRKSLPSPGRTPFPLSKSASKEKNLLNVTRSIEKSSRRSSLVNLPRATKVMFSSPTNNSAAVTQMKGKIIKSSLKGSNKSFLFDESVSKLTHPQRKRSYTQNEADELRRKRKRFADDQQQSVERLSRSRTTSATARLQDPGTSSKKSLTLSTVKSELMFPEAKSEGKVLRTKLPNFAELHRKHFSKMESLDQCQERKAKRARQLLTPTGSKNIIERISPKETQSEDLSSEIQPKKSDPKQPALATDKTAAGYTRFGFKLNLDVNPFSIPARNTEVKPKQHNAHVLLKRQGTMPSLTGATSVRREAAKQSIMREKSFTEKRDVNRNENRTVIKGVRTNRRFELQMKMRNVNN